MPETKTTKGIGAASVESVVWKAIKNSTDMHRPGCAGVHKGAAFSATHSQYSGG